MSDREPLARGPEIPRMRRFDTGATRNTDATKHDYEGFLSPYVIRRFGAYMHEHRQTPEGLRDSDNWQSGIPRDVYMKSMWRHFMDVWEIHRTGKPLREGERFIDLDEALMALLFNVQGMAHEILKEESGHPSPQG